MKKICKLIVFIVLFLGCIKVNAEIDFDSLKLEYEKEFDYGTISETNNGISIIFTSNNAEFNGITDKSVIENYGDVYYILNGGAAQKATLFNYNQFFINVDSELAKTNEMNIEIYFLSKDNKKSGSSKFTYLITENGIKNTKMKKPILN